MITGRIQSIQWLRAVAAFLVVSFHAFGHVSPELPDSIRTLLDSGVDLFFVISGCVIWLTTADRDISLRAFIRSRFLRVVPVYWLAIAVGMIVAAVRGKNEFSAGEVLKSALFVPYFNGDGPTVFPVTGVGWTLNLEMFFYTCFALALLFPLLPRAAMFIIAFPLLAWAGSVRTTNSALFTAYSNPMIIEFSLGIIAGILVRARLPAAFGALLVTSAILLLASTIAMHQPGLSRVLIFGVPYFCLVTGLAVLEGARTFPPAPWLSHLGDASYSTYLFHGYPVAVAGKVIHALHNLAFQTVAALVFIAISGMVGSVVYTYVERPVRGAAADLLDRLGKTRKRGLVQGGAD